MAITYSNNRPVIAPMSVFERYLTVWVFLCIVAGIALGQLLPSVFQAIGRMEIARVNLPVGLLIWVMIVPWPYPQRHIGKPVTVADRGS